VKYEGGICYQKFKNLDSCKVCVPYNYRELKDKNISDIIKNILEKADHLTEDACRKFDGYFFELNKKEADILVEKTKNIKPNELEFIPKIKYNIFYLECMNKLKSTYFENLKALLNVLEKMKEMPIINNETLNIKHDLNRKLRKYNIIVKLILIQQ